jgi:hypothetical protein
MGLGTYPRVAAARINDRALPSNFVLGRDGERQYVSFLVRSATYFGQKVRLLPAGDLHLALAVRPHGGPTTVVVFLCAKWLLYSADCVSMPLSAPAVDQWNPVVTNFAASALEGLRRPGIVPRPVELSFSFSQGQRVDISDVSLLDAAGDELIANGRFTDGTARWQFTDDDHIAWRVMNLYLLIFFEGGAVGLAGFLALVAASLAGGLAGVRRGAALGAPVVASLLAFLAAGVMDGLADAQRLMSVFFLVVLLGMLVRVIPVERSVPEMTSASPIK